MGQYTTAGRILQEITAKKKGFCPVRMEEGPWAHPMGEVMKTMKLTQKESMLLQDLKTSEEICIEKYGQYAQKAEDQALADLFLTIRSKEEEHLKTIDQLMQGTVPMMAGGQQNQQNGQSSQPGSGKAAQKSNSKSDEYLLKDALDTEKHVSSVYDTCIFEFTDPGARQVLNHIQKEEQEHGQMLYDYMACHGMTA